MMMTTVSKSAESLPLEKPAEKRLNVNLSEAAFAEVRALSRSTNRSMTEIVRLGLNLAKIALEEQAQGHRLVVTSQDGRPVKELVLA